MNKDMPLILNNNHAFGAEKYLGSVYKDKSMHIL